MSEQHQAMRPRWNGEVTLELVTSDVDDDAAFGYIRWVDLRRHRTSARGTDSPPAHLS